MYFGDNDVIIVVWKWLHNYRHKISRDLHKTKRHHSVKTERRHSVTFQSTHSRLNGRYISVTIQWPFSAIQSPFRRLSVLFNFFFSVYNLSYKALFLHIFDARSTGIMSECNTHIWYFKDYSNTVYQIMSEIIWMWLKIHKNGRFSL